MIRIFLFLLLTTIAVIAQGKAPPVNTETAQSSELSGTVNAVNTINPPTISNHLSDNYIFFGQSISLTIWYALITTILIIFAVSYYLIRQQKTHDNRKTSIVFSST